MIMRTFVKLTAVTLLSSLFLAAAPGNSQPLSADPPEASRTISAMVSLFAYDEQNNRSTLEYLDNSWVDGYLPMLVEVLYLSRDRVDEKGIINLIEKKSGQSFGNDSFAWLEWMWNRNQELLPFHGDWMARIYRGIDPKFAQYFKGRTGQSLIRLEEVRWGGVKQDGIPPLRQPAMLAADEADYLRDNNVVFGVSINGDHRAYPKRILAWHEMFVDEVGGRPIAGVYCTLCGTVIAYDTEFQGKRYELGTSGFLYRSNKLMYDQATQSLWNTIEGKPVIGPLAEQGIELSSHAVVTTTWGEWKKLHPDTKVLSLDTGHNRDYGEGAAYRSYFATDELMFNVPELDGRLKNKDEVLIVRADDYQADPLAISAKFLKKNPVYQDRIGEQAFVVLTDRSGANRVYRAGDVQFTKLQKASVQDSEGVTWAITEEQITAPDGRVLERLPYHRIFWFAWFNTYKNTRLVR